jgi:hypothetical protein|tara:strand:- start:3000 stop:3971 length:972 start_codon:yes stop_codon:yes gene_type:complete
MTINDPQANIAGTDGTYPVHTAYYPSVEGAGLLHGGSGHFQLMGLAFDNGGNSWATATEASGYPVRIPAASTIGTYIQDVWGCIGTAGGGSAFNVEIKSNAGLTVNAIISDLIVGITMNRSHESSTIGVYGTGGTAVGMTGSVYIINNDLYQHNGHAVFGTGGSSVGGDVGVTGQVKLDSSSIIGVFGMTAYGSSKGLDLGVTGQVKIDPTSMIGISGGITIGNMVDIAVKMPSNGVISGAFTPGILGMSLAARGLSSGVKITAFSTGATTDFVFVGGPTSHGLSLTGYPLREMDSIFLEIDDMKYVCVSSDNAAATFRYIAT